MRIKVTKAQYDILKQKVLLPLPVFLQYMAAEYPEYDKKTCYDFYLKTRALVLEQPLFLHCELTADCNLDCKMCYVHIEKEAIKKCRILTTEEWLDILRQAADAGVYEVCLSGGEAMIHEGFWEIYEYLHKRGIIVSVFTNGLAITESAIKRFKALPPKEIQLSLYGTNNSTYEAVTGYRVFNAVDKAVSLIKEAGIPLILAITPCKQLYNNISEIIDYARAHKCRYRVNNMLIPARNETGRNNEGSYLTDEECANILKMLPDVKNQPAVTDDDSLHQALDETTDSIGVSCLSGMISCHINYSGLMNGCAFLPISNINLLNTSFAEAWKLVHEKSLNYHLPLECVNCKHYEKCFKCPGIHYLTVGEGVCNKSICKRTEFYLQQGILR